MKKSVTFKDGSTTILDSGQITPAVEKILKSKGYSDSDIVSLKTSFISTPAPSRGKVAAPPMPSIWDTVATQARNAIGQATDVQPQQIPAQSLRPTPEQPTWAENAVNAAASAIDKVVPVALKAIPSLPMIGNAVAPEGYHKAISALSNAGQALEDFITKNPAQKFDDKVAGQVLSHVLPYSADEITKYMQGQRQELYGMIDPLKLPAMTEQFYNKPGTVFKDMAMQLGTEKGWKEHTVANLAMVAPLVLHAYGKLNERGAIGPEKPPPETVTPTGEVVVPEAAPSEPIPKSPPIPKMTDESTALIPIEDLPKPKGFAQNAKQVAIRSTAGFAKEDVGGTLIKAGQSLASTAKAFQGLLAPGTMSKDAHYFDMERRAISGETNAADFATQRIFNDHTFWNPFNSIRSQMEGWTKRQVFDFDAAINKGEPQATPELEAIADVFRAQNRANIDFVAGLDPGRAARFTESWIGRSFKWEGKNKGAAAKDLHVRNVLGGEGGFLQAQKHATLEDAVNYINKIQAEKGIKPGHGLVPKSWNPADNMILKSHEIRQWGEGLKVENLLDSMGVLSTEAPNLVEGHVVIRNGEPYAKLNGRMFEVYQKRRVKTTQAIADNEAAQKLAKRQGAAVDEGIMPDGYINEKGEFVEGAKPGFAPKGKKPVYSKTENDISKKYTPEEQAVIENEKALQHGTNREMPVGMRRTGVKRDSAAASGRAAYREAIKGGYSEGEAAAIGTATYHAWTPEDYATAAGDTTGINKNPYPTGRVVDGHLVPDIPDPGATGSAIPRKSDATPLRDEWVLTGHRYAPKPIADIINRHWGLSAGEGAWGGVFDAYKAINNAMRQVNLLGFFHIGAETRQAWMSTITAALENTFAGNLKAAGLDVGRLGAAPVFDVHRGSHIMDVMIDPKKAKGPRDTATVQMIKDSGVRPTMDGVWKNNAVKSLTDQLITDPHNIPKVALKGIMATIERVAGITMDDFVPRLKLGALDEAFHTAINKLPMSVREQIKTALKDGTTDSLPRPVRLKYLETIASVADSIDNRMGQLNWANLNLPKGLTDFLQNAFLAPMWTGGFLREMGGGVLDLTVKLPKDAIKYFFEREKAPPDYALPPGEGGGGGGGEVPPGSAKGAIKMRSKDSRAAMIDKPQITSRLVYALLGGVIVHAVESTIRQWIHTRKLLWNTGTTGTQRVKDTVENILNPQTGRVDKYGVKQRETAPDQFKDVKGFIREPLTTIFNKQAPLLRTGTDIWLNRDYSNTQIANPKDNLGQRVLDKAKYFGKQGFNNFTMQSIITDKERGMGWPTVIDSLLGRRPTKKSVQNDTFYNVLQETQAENLGKATPRLKAEAAHGQLVNKMAMQHKEGKLYKEDIADALKSRTISQNDLAEILLEKPKENPVQKALKTFNTEQMKELWETATDDQKRMVLPFFVEKYARLKPGDDREGKDFKQNMIDIMTMGEEVGIPKETMRDIMLYGKE